MTVPAVPWSDLEIGSAEPSDAIRGRVARGRDRAGARWPGASGFRNADLSASDIEPSRELETDARRLLGRALESLGLSVRALYRSLKVARTVADLAGAERVGAPHLAEAISYRLRVREAPPEIA